MAMKRKRGEKKRGREEEGDDDPLKLKLGNDPWTVKKKLTKSDLNGLSRVILPGDQVKKNVLPHLNSQELHDVEWSNGGHKVWVEDLDEGSLHLLSFKTWKSNGSYKLGLNWISEFVKKRKLRNGDMIGMFWDDSTRGFCFSVLKRSPQPPPDPSLCKFARKYLCLSPRTPLP
ncbi:B3 domain-containing protein At5g26805-like [Macadamia integrifolia]|uniref:B3 domain-containing protein At5g26805-like n=1 Tax=Macadamia integrifolia TaxID=60698 RepID=UPI001C500F69|nr:B3 domain-containing protein At5g26805-like [Macadamia integrifolia]